MNIEELVKDERGLEMVLSLHKVTDNNIVFCYDNLTKYVSEVGIEEAYDKYCLQRKKGVYNEYNN